MCVPLLQHPQPLSLSGARMRGTLWQLREAAGARKPAVTQCSPSPVGRIRPRRTDAPRGPQGWCCAVVPEQHLISPAFNSASSKQQVEQGRAPPCPGACCQPPAPAPQGAAGREGLSPGRRCCREGLEALSAAARGCGAGKRHQRPPPSHWAPSCPPLAPAAPGPRLHFPR